MYVAVHALFLFTVPSMKRKLSCVATLEDICDEGLRILGIIDKELEHLEDNVVMVPVSDACHKCYIDTPGFPKEVWESCSAALAQMGRAG